MYTYFTKNLRNECSAFTYLSTEILGLRPASESPHISRNYRGVDSFKFPISCQEVLNRYIARSRLAGHTAILFTHIEVIYLCTNELKIIYSSTYEWCLLPTCNQSLIDFMNENKRTSNKIQSASEGSIRNTTLG